MAVAQVSSSQRHTRRAPCLICGGHADLPQGKGIRCAGYRSADGLYEYCTREEYASDLLPKKNTMPPAYAHLMDGACRCGKTHIPQARSSTIRRLPPRETIYRLVDTSGKLAGIHHRVDYLDSSEKPYRKKRIWWSEHDGRSSKAMPLYGLEDLLVTEPHTTVWVVEGEKTRDALQVVFKGVGLTDVVVGIVSGAPMVPCDDTLLPLVGHPVILWPDHDLPKPSFPQGEGVALMQGIASRLAVLKGSVPRWVVWREAPEKGDAFDFLANGGTVQQLDSMLSDTLLTEPVETDDDANTYPTNTLDVESFPVHALPSSMRRFVEESAQAIGCPPDFVGTSTLAFASVAIGTSRCLQLKKHWRELPLLWIAMVGKSGDRKSAALKDAGVPLADRELQLHRQWQKALKEWRDNPDSSADSSTRPQRSQLNVTDTTVEALVDSLQVNTRGMILQRDELTGWVFSMNQYKSGKGSDKTVWLSLWNASQIMVNRRTRGDPLFVDQPFVSVIGGLPPDMLGELTDERGREDGFIQRILFCYPDPIPLMRTVAEVSDQTAADYVAVFNNLCRLAPERDTDDTVRPRVIGFSIDGERAWHAWEDEHFREMNDPYFPDHLHSAWSKMHAYAARLTLVIHLCRQVSEELVPDEVDAESVRAGVALAEYFKSHARRVYAFLRARPMDRRITAVLSWMRRHNCRSASVRDLERAGVAGVRSKDEVMRLVEDLVNQGLGTIIEDANHPGKKSRIFALRPTPDN